MMRLNAIDRNFNCKQLLTIEQLIRKAPSIGATKPFKAMSERYSFVPTIKAVSHLKRDGWMPIMASESRCNLDEKKGFQKHMIRLTKPDLMIGKERLDLVLYNSHNGAAAFQLVAGIFRLVCGNGLIVGNKMMEFSHKHIGFDADAFVESAKMINGRMNDVAEVVEDWKAIEMTPDEKGIFAYASHGLLYGEEKEPEKVPITPEQLLVPRRWEDKNSNSLWTAYNIVQENMTKGGISGTDRNGRRRRTRAIKQLDKDRKLNQALWTLTEKMAELKNEKR